MDSSTVSLQTSTDPSITFMPSEHSTYVGHLWNHGNVGFMGEDRWVVIDVLDSNDELRGGLQGSAALAVGSCCNETILVLLLSVQRLGDVDVSRVAVNNKHRSHTFSFQRVLCVSISSVHICVQLENHTQRE